MSGTERIFLPFPWSVITAGASNRTSRTQMSTSSLTRAAVLYRTVSKTKSHRPLFVEVSGMESSNFRLLAVRYYAGGDDATFLGILWISGLHGGDDILTFYQLSQNLELLFCGGEHLIPLLFRQDGRSSIGFTVNLLQG